MDLVFRSRRRIKEEAFVDSEAGSPPASELGLRRQRSWGVVVRFFWRKAGALWSGASGRRRADLRGTCLATKVGPALDDEVWDGNHDGGNRMFLDFMRVRS